MNTNNNTIRQSVYAILIPAYNPTEKLFNLIETLEKYKWPVVIVDDGSKNNFPFQKLKIIHPGVKVLSCSTNRGKGAALKTGLRYIYEEHRNLVGVVTVDCDGQHIKEDIIKVMKNIRRDSLVLGVRDLNKIPFLFNRLGNKLTSYIFKLVMSRHIPDTQTGLRGIHKNLIPIFLKIPYNRYDFEFFMLLICIKLNIKIIPVPINTIYFKKKASFFRPITDSVRIYTMFFKYLGEISCLK